MIRHVLVVGRHQVRIHLGTLRRRPGPHLVTDGLQPLVQNFVMTIVELRNKETPPKLVSNRSICQTPRPVPVSDPDLDIWHGVVPAVDAAAAAGHWRHPLGPVPTALRLQIRKHRRNH